MRKFLLGAAVALLAPALANAADLSGAWKFQTSGAQGAKVMTCTFTQDGGKISGPCVAPSGANVSSSGTVTDTQLDFGYVAADGSTHVDLKGDIQPDGTVKGTLSIAGTQVAVPFTGAKQ